MPKDANAIVNVVRGFVTLTKQAAAFIEKQASQEERIAAAVPSTVDSLIERGLLDPLDKQAMTRTLMSHEECLKAITTTAKYAQAPSLGSPVAPVTTNDDARPGFSRERESDRRFVEAILGR